MSTGFPDYVSRIDLEKRIAEIARSGLNRRLLLLIGAGFSADARGYPTGAGLVSILVKETYSCTDEEAVKAAAKYELAAIAQQFTERATEKRPGMIAHVRHSPKNRQSGLRPNWLGLGCVDLPTASYFYREFRHRYGRCSRQEGPRGQ